MAINFYMPSGSPAGFVEVEGLTPGATEDPEWLGFFGVGGPGNSVAVGSYQDETYLVDFQGNDHGQGLNNKFVNSTTVQHSGVSRTLPLVEQSGSLVVRFTHGSDVQTQSARLYAVQLNASSGVTLGEAPDNLTSQLVEIGVDSSWTDASTDGANFLTLNNHTTTAGQHDFHVGISMKPNTTGIKRDWGFHFSVEFF
jgi:hypothetical protein